MPLAKLLLAMKAGMASLAYVSHDKHGVMWKFSQVGSDKETIVFCGPSTADMSADEILKNAENFAISAFEKSAERGGGTCFRIHAIGKQLEWTEVTV